jgi:hypothetical protein
MPRVAWFRSPADDRMSAYEDDRDRRAVGDDEFTLPASPDPWDSWAAKSPSRHEVTVTGRLGFDDIEGGCSFLETDEETRYEVAYPDGWTLDRMGAELRGPGGQLARAGESVTVRGAIATDRSSICQIGPIFVATDVEIQSA